MAYVILGDCVNDGACVNVCPVDAIHPTQTESGFAKADMLYIDPGSCVDCNACAEACPINAIANANNLTGSNERYIEINRNFFQQ